VGATGEPVVTLLLATGAIMSAGRDKPEALGPDHELAIRACTAAV
jgi:hypothetical protein